MLSGFRFGWYGLRLSPLELLQLPAGNAANVLRGALGLMLRAVCCDDACPGARECPQRFHCVYARAFEPAPPPDSPALSNYEAIPRPFVVRPPLDGKTSYTPGQAFRFELILIGEAIGFLPQFTAAFGRLAEAGFGPSRARCTLDWVEQYDAQGRAVATAFSRGKAVAPLAPAITRLPALPASDHVAVRFLTPTHLVAGGETITEPEFHHLIKRLRDRLNALATFYCGGPLEWDFAEIGRQAEAVKRTGSDLRWVERERLSSRTGQRHSIGGLVGECTFAGPVEKFLPLLQLGQYVHVGKHAAWGNGRLAVRVV